MVYALLCIGLCCLSLNRYYDDWYIFVSILILSTIYTFLKHSIVFKYGINEFINAKSSLSMLDTIEKEKTSELNLETFEQWKKYWSMRDKLILLFNWTLAIVLVIMLVSNLVYIIIRGEQYDPKDNHDNKLLCNLQFLVGYQTIFFVQFCFCFVYMLIIMLIFLMSSYWYYQAYRSVKKLK